MIPPSPHWAVEVELFQRVYNMKMSWEGNVKKVEHCNAL